jgi:predicted DNA-binding mobile mystery protein A
MEAAMNRKSYNRLMLKQVSESIQKQELMPTDVVGSKVRHIREALGMSQKQLAKKLGTTQQAVNKIEHSSGSMTLKTLNRISAVFGFQPMISLVSGVTLEQMIEAQAEKKAGSIVKKTEATMAMEKQTVDKKSYKKSYDELVREFAENPAPSLWEDID